MSGRLAGYTPVHMATYLPNVNVPALLLDKCGPNTQADTQLDLHSVCLVKPHPSLFLYFWGRFRANICKLTRGPE